MWNYRVGVTSSCTSSKKCRIYGPKNRNIAKDLFFSLYALQHRGQEGAGMAVVSKQDNLFHVQRGMGLVMQVSVGIHIGTGVAFV